MRRRAYLLWLMCASAAPAFAQDISADLRFYPLEIGNEWHYVTQRFYGGGDLSYEVVEVTKDTASAGGQTYRVQRVETLNEFGTEKSTFYRYQRIDSSTGIVFQFSITTGEEHPVHHVALTDTSVWMNDPVFNVGCGAISEEKVLELIRRIKGCTLRVNFPSPGPSYRYAEGVGIYEANPDITGHLPSLQSLLYAKIEGKEFGTPISVSTNEMPFFGPSLKVDVYPNPTTGSFAFTFSLSRPQRVNMYLFDILGKRLAGYENAHFTAGIHTQSIGMPEGASGVHWLRIDAEEGISVQSVILVR